MKFSQNDLNLTIELINRTNLQYMSYIDNFSDTWDEDELNIAYKMVANMTAIIKELKNITVTENNFEEIFVVSETYSLIYGELSKIVSPLLSE